MNKIKNISIELKDLIIRFFINTFKVLLLPLKGISKIAKKMFNKKSLKLYIITLVTITTTIMMVIEMGLR